jgi:hypothetical protein
MSVESTLAAAFACWLGAMEAQSHAATPSHGAKFSGTQRGCASVTDNVAEVHLFARKVAKTGIPIPGGFVADVAVWPCATGDARRLNVDVVAISV